MEVLPHGERGIAIVEVSEHLESDKYEDQAQQVDENCPVGYCVLFPPRLRNPRIVCESRAGDEHRHVGQVGKKAPELILLGWQRLLDARFQTRLQFSIADIAFLEVLL